jgi:hypothetical protein
MINEYIVQYYFGNMKIKYGKMSNERFCLYVCAHDEEEAKKLAKMQIRCSQHRTGEITIIGVEHRIIEA